MTKNANGLDENLVAIVGMAGRFPNAKNVDEFWNNLCAGTECIEFFSDKELEEAGVPSDIYRSENYVAAAATLEGCDQFDATLFKYTPREAALIDPQQRVFLESAWHALEHAGHTADQFSGRIGVYAGAAMNTYAFNFMSNRSMNSAADLFQSVIGNDKDYLSTRVAYKMNLEGPAVTVQTACSSSLTAVHMATQALLTDECDMALAGGVSVKVPQKSGYFYQKGMIFSKDGRCRAFAENAEGCLFGSGVGIVVLRRLRDAVDDGDQILAVVRGSSVTNDGADKVGFTAPSVEGQSRTIAEALAIAGVRCEEVSYVEAHGTGTPLGDPVEIEALSNVFKASTDKTGFCAIGSVKTNVGHLDAAAGITGFMKTVLMLHHRQLVPSLNYEKPNPHIDFPKTPFFVNTETRPWDSKGNRIAGVSSFGIGGTNAHVVLEEWVPATTQSSDGTDQSKELGWQILPVSAASENALNELTRQVGELLSETDSELANVAFTLQCGRQRLNHRRFAVVEQRADAAKALLTLDPKKVFNMVTDTKQRPVAFLFPGGGAQYLNMGLELYQQLPVYKEVVDTCAELLMPILGLDIRDIVFPEGVDNAQDVEKIRSIEYALPSLFITEYAIARQWIAWGIEPQALVGHSIGEYVAACVADVFSLADALTVVAARARLMAKAKPGYLLNAVLSEQEATPYLSSGLELAAINSPTTLVFTGQRVDIEALQERLVADSVDCQILPIDIGAHSALMEPILDEFQAQVAQVELKPPKLPFISNVTGDWAAADEVTQPRYWAKQLRSTVRFSDAISLLANNASRVLLEVGPGQSLSSIARRHPARKAEQVVIATMRHSQDDVQDVPFVLEALGKCWLTGVDVAWKRIHSVKRQRLSIPKYPFEHQSYWINPRIESAGALALADEFSDSSIDDASNTERSTIGMFPRPQLMTAFVAAQSELEVSVSQIWQNAFRIEGIGVYDNFFELGGTSLLAAELATQLSVAVNVDLGAKDVLAAPTIHELCHQIAESMGDDEQAQVAKVMEQLMSMSDEQARQLLQEQDEQEKAACSDTAQPKDLTESVK